MIKRVNLRILSMLDVIVFGDLVPVDREVSRASLNSAQDEADAGSIKNITGIGSFGRHFET